MNELLWTPSEELITNSNITSFIRYVENLLGKAVKNYNDLYNWSVSDIEEFWKSIWIISGTIHSKNYNRILTEYKMPGARWFEGAELNFAENLLKYRDNKIAIISAREDAETFNITYEELFNYVASAANALKKMGVEKGDRVAGFVSNIPEAIIAMLAAASIGALWSSCSPDFGFQGVIDRFGQIQPKVLFAVESYQYNGNVYDCSEKIRSIVENISEIKNLVLIPRFFDFKNPSAKEHKISVINTVYFEDLLNNENTKLEFVQLPFDHPVYIMYSSGTTGKPKCIVHGAGGTLLQHFKELSLHTNLKREDVITYYTTCGWMMWNWLVSSLSIGAAIFLYEGSPVYPNVNVLWKKIEEEKITIFGTSPKYLSICQKAGIIPSQQFDLSSLKTILSTGAPLSEELFKWVYSDIKNDIQLSSIAGGTDIISCFMLGSPILPVYAGEIQCRGLGMKVEVYDEKGNSVVNRKGELVCTAPFPSMPVFFWNDDENKNYKSAYFDYYPGIWRHGDFIKITEHGGIVVYGRSDATLNPGGVRIGTAEIYKIAEAIDEVEDSLVIGQNWKEDVRIILFIVLKKGLSINKNLINKIKNEIKLKASPRHIPAKVIQVNDIPRTINMKKVEIAVTRIIHGEEIENKEAIANPESLEQFKNLEELKN